MTSRTSSSVSMRRAAGPGLPGKTGWSTTRPSARSCSPTALGNEKWAAWSPWRWPISRRPTRKANSPRRPGPASTPGQEVTCSVMVSAAVLVAVMAPWCTEWGPSRQGQLVLGRSLHADERVEPAVGEVLVAVDGDEARALVDLDRARVEGRDVEDERPGPREGGPRLEERPPQAAAGEVGPQAEADLLARPARLDHEEAREPAGLVV